ncbi:hypothetical protein BH23GEM9_BH23GEM9_02430 [soil metagenome]
MFIILGMMVALGIGIYVGLGAPGMKGREDRIVTQGRPKRLQKRHIDWLRTDRR